MWDAMLDRVARWQASAGFRRAATAFPLTRPVARRRANALFDLCAGFVYSQVLRTVVQLDLPARLLAGPRSVPVLAAELDLPAFAAERLLEAATALGLAARRNGGYGLGPLGAALVDNPGVAAMVAHHAALYDDLRDPVALLRGQAGPTQLHRFWPYAGDGAACPGAARSYTALMAASLPMVADEVLAAVDVRRHRHLLDVGGGTGAFLHRAARRAPHLRLTLFDLPDVAALARTAPGNAGNRVTVVGGDARRDGLPAGADLITFNRVLHDHPDESVLRLLRAARTALAPGGRVVVAEPMADAPGSPAMGAGYFGFYLLAMGSGQPRTAARHVALLREAGFARPRLRRTRLPLVAQVIVAG